MWLNQSADYIRDNEAEFLVLDLHLATGEPMESCRKLVAKCDNNHLRDLLNIRRMIDEVKNEVREILESL